MEKIDHMENKMRIIPKRGYIHVSSNGKKDSKFAYRLWSNTVKVCRKNECFNIFGIANTSHALKLVDCYNHARLFQELGIDYKYRIAWVELNPDAFELIKFIETVLTNRGINVRLFSDITEAKNWLLKKRELKNICVEEVLLAKRV